MGGAAYQSELMCYNYHRNVAAWHGELLSKGSVYVHASVKHGVKLKVTSCAQQCMQSKTLASAYAAYNQSYL